MPPKKKVERAPQENIQVCAQQKLQQMQQEEG